MVARRLVHELINNIITCEWQSYKLFEYFVKMKNTVNNITDFDEEVVLSTDKKLSTRDYYRIF